MSRGFVKEEDQEEVPLVPPRAHLPSDAENFVTEIGYQALLDEKQNLILTQDHLDKSQEKDYRIAYNYLNAKLQLLNERIATAKVIDVSKLPQDEVHFGAFVTFQNLKTQETFHFQLVGVDEAEIKNKKLSFITPLAKVLMNKKIGDKATLKLGSASQEFLIIKISY